MSKTYKGKFTPTNPEKYVGDVNNIIYRSSWERAYFRYCDTHSNILNWNSEGVVVPYLSPLDNRMHRYYIDVWVRFKRVDGSIGTKIIEIKPAKETRPPKPRKKMTPRYKREIETWIRNSAKWEAAEKFAKSKGTEFIKLTENELCFISPLIKPERKKK